MLDLRGSDLVQRFRGDRAAYEAHVHAVAPGLEELDGRQVGLQQHQDQDQRQQPPAAEEGAAQRELVALRHVCELYERQACVRLGPGTREGRGAPKLNADRQSHKVERSSSFLGSGTLLRITRISLL